jgi:nitrogen regulatory protein P-II 1
VQYTAFILDKYWTGGIVSMKKLEIITPNGRLSEVQEALKEMNVGGMSHYGIEGSGRVKVDPVVSATHPTRVLPEYIMRRKVEVVVKDSQVEELISKVRARLANDPQGGKIFVTDVPLAVDIKTNSRGEEVI